MSNADDIVTRLHENCGCFGAEEFGYNCTNCDAANEIERLRKIIVGLKGSEMCDPNDPCEMCKE